MRVHDRCPENPGAVLETRGTGQWTQLLGPAKRCRLCKNRTMGHGGKPRSITAMSTSLKCAVLTVSDRRDAGTDTSGTFRAECVVVAGNECTARQIVKDNVYQIRHVLSDWIADDGIQVIITTGCTGFASRGSTPEAVIPLLDKQIIELGELF